MVSPSHVLEEIWALQRDRWLLWLAPALILGAAVWLLAPDDPPWWIGPATAVAGAGLCLLHALWISHAPGWLLGGLRTALVARGALLVSLGLGAIAAQVRTASVSQPVFRGSDQAMVLEGWIVANEPSATGSRVRLLTRSVNGVADPPRYVRVSVASAGVLTPGRAARCRAVLAPPSGPMAPGAYDFARRAYFERLGATGFAYGRCRPANFAGPPGWIDQQRLALAAVRSDLSAAIYAAAPTRGGAIAAALVTGDRSSVDEETNEALQNSGLGHLLSVSGIHMGVVGGLVFAVLLWCLSLISPLALRFPVKKIAAVGALMVLGVYLVISGASVPALRSFVMACVAFGAILLDRPAISMRGLALAALIVVLIFPESVLEPGFQMSFAATMALVALFEMLKRAPHEPALPAPGPLIGALQSISQGIGGVLLISFVAGLATDPFAIYHFQRFAVYSLPANLITAPIMSFLVAPLAAAAAVLAPFGLADPALQLMASALDLVAAIGQTFGDRPEAVRALPRPPDLAFVLCVLALVWACLWRGWLRWGGALFFAASVWTYLAAPQPMLAFDGDLRAVYARTGEHWSLLTRGRSTYARDRLGAMLGFAPSELERLAPPQCTDSYCVLEENTSIAMITHAEGFKSTCRRFRVIITRETAPADHSRRCEVRMLIDAVDLARLGGGLVFDGGETLRVQRATPSTTRRPWSPEAVAFDQE